MRIAIIYILAVVLTVVLAHVIPQYLYWGDWDCVFSRCVTIVEEPY